MDGGRRRGPKPQGPFEDKRRTLTTRITEDVRAKLDAAALADGRSLSQEIELRLDRSFQNQDRLEEALRMAYGRQGARLLNLLGHLMRGGVAYAVEGDWLSDTAARGRAVRAMIWFLRRLHEGGPLAGSVDSPEHRADELLWILGDENEVGSLAAMGAIVREDLGKLMAEHLVAMRQADRAAIVAAGPREAPAPGPAIQALWSEAFATAGIPLRDQPPVVPAKKG